MKMKFFDYEVYPDWWCIVVSDEEESYNSKPYDYKFTAEEEAKIKSKMRTYTSDDGAEGRSKLLADMRTNTVTGYNIKRYDLVIQKCIEMNFTPRQLYIASQIVTEKHDYPEAMHVTQLEINRISQYVKGWRARWAGAEAYQDLMDDSDKGLKDKEASFGMSIQETTVPFGTMNLTQEQKDDIIFYCKHDTYALHVLYVCVSEPYVATKLDLAETNGLSDKVAYENTNAVLVGKVLGAERVHGTTITDPTIRIYQTPLNDYIYKWVPKEPLEHLLTSQKARQFNLFGNKVHTADGGIHSTIILPTSKDTAIYAETTEYYGLFNVDLSGCHPSVMCFAGAMPRSIKKPEVFIESVLGRREVKKKPKSEWTTKEKKLVRGWKLQHNTTYGAAGNDKLPLYDDYMRSKVCRVSQLIVIAVSMDIFTNIPNSRILQTNTDGILVYMQKQYYNKLKNLINEFEVATNFKFEFDEDDRIWQFNVNNYIAVDIDGNDKLKGKTFNVEIWQRGTNKVRPLGYHVITKAQYEFYVNKKNPVEFLLKHENVNDFAMNATKGKTYFKMVHTIDGVEYDVGKVTRVIAVMNDRYGEVRKLKDNAKDLVAKCPPHALIVADSLENYYITGDYANRSICHKITGVCELLDIGFYANMLESTLDKVWYKLKDGVLTATKEFDLASLVESD